MAHSPWRWRVFLLHTRTKKWKWQQNFTVFFDTTCTYLSFICSILSKCFSYHEYIFTFSDSFSWLLLLLFKVIRLVVVSILPIQPGNFYFCFDLWQLFNSFTAISLYYSETTSTVFMSFSFVLRFFFFNLTEMLVGIFEIYIILVECEEMCKIGFSRVKPQKCMLLLGRFNELPAFCLYRKCFVGFKSAQKYLAKCIKSVKLIDVHLPIHTSAFCMNFTHFAQ